MGTSSLCDRSKEHCPFKVQRSNLQASERSNAAINRTGSHPPGTSVYPRSQLWNGGKNDKEGEEVALLINTVRDESLEIRIGVERIHPTTKRL